MLHRSNTLLDDELSDIRLVVNLLCRLGNGFEARDQSEKALKLFRRSVVCVELQESFNIRNETAAIAYSQLSWALMERGDLSEAFAYAQREESVWKELENSHQLARCLGRQAIICGKLGESQEALDLHREVERLCRTTSDTPGVVRSLIHQARLLSTELDRISTAFEVLKQAYREADQHDLEDFLDQVLESMSRAIYWAIKSATTFEDKGDISIAGTLLDEASDLAEQFTLEEELAWVNYNRAFLIATKLRDPLRALPVAKHAERLAQSQSANQLHDIIIVLIQAITQDIVDL